MIARNVLNLCPEPLNVGMNFSTHPVSALRMARPPSMAEILLAEADHLGRLLSDVRVMETKRPTQAVDFINGHWIWSSWA